MSWRWHDNQVSNGNAKQIFGRKQKAKKGEFLPSQVTRKGGNTGKGISYVWGRFSPFWQCIQKYFDCVRIKIDVSKWKSSSSSSVMMVSIRISVRGTGVSVWGAYANQAVTLLITNTAEIHSSSHSKYIDCTFNKTHACCKLFTVQVSQNESVWNFQWYTMSGSFGAILNNSGSFGLCWPYCITWKV